MDRPKTAKSVAETSEASPVSNGASRDTRDAPEARNAYQLPPVPHSSDLSADMNNMSLGSEPSLIGGDDLC